VEAVAAISEKGPLPFNAGAAAVIEALKAVEDEKETVWLHRGLLAIADLSQLTSVSARALRSNLVWNESSRSQTRQGANGKPGSQYFLPRGLVGLSVSNLLSKAEAVADATFSGQVGELHIVTALVQWMPNALRELGVNPEQLIAEVAAMEKGPIEDRIKKALELEVHQFAKAADKLADDVSQKSLQTRSQFTLHGHGSVSTPLWGALIRLEFDRLEQLVQEAANVRRETCKKVQELGSPGQLAQWRNRLQGRVDSEFATLHLRIVGLVGGAQYENEVRKFILDRSEWSSRLSKIKGAVDREAEMISREVSLGVYEPAKPTITVNISGGIVGALNLGTVVGDMNTAMGSLQARGGEELAQALKRLTEAVVKAEELGEQRREIVEALALVTEQAALSPEHRKVGVVNALLTRWQPVLVAASSVAEVWTALHPLLTTWFGIP